jgi:hypothetical protein
MLTPMDSSAVCLQDFSGDALNVKFSTTGLTELKVFNGLLSSGELLRHIALGHLVGVDCYRVQ